MGRLNRSIRDSSILQYPARAGRLYDGDPPGCSRHCACRVCPGTNGKGQYVDISMSDSAFAAFNILPEIGDYLLNGVLPKRGEGLFTGTHPWYAAYETADNKFVKV